MPSSVAAVAARPHVGRGFQLYASAQAEPRARRPTDIALVIVSVSTLALAIAFAEIATSFEAQLSRLLDVLPGLLEPLWRTALWAPVAYGAD